MIIGATVKASSTGNNVVLERANEMWQQNVKIRPRLHYGDSNFHLTTGKVCNAQVWEV